MSGGRVSGGRGDWLRWSEDGWPEDAAEVAQDTAEDIAAMAEAAEAALSARLLAARFRAQHAEMLESEANRHGFTTFVDWSEIAYALAYGCGDPLWNNGRPPWHSDGGARPWPSGTDGSP